MHFPLAAWGEHATVLTTAFITQNSMAPGAELSNSYEAVLNEAYGTVCAYAPLPFEALAAGGCAPVCAPVSADTPVQYASAATALVHTLRVITNPSATGRSAIRSLPAGAYISTLTIMLRGPSSGVLIDIPLTRVV